jgi:hypothetical protein
VQWLMQKDSQHFQNARDEKHFQIQVGNKGRERR